MIKSIVHGGIVKEVDGHIQKVSLNFELNL